MLLGLNIQDIIETTRVENFITNTNNCDLRKCKELLMEAHKSKWKA